MLHISTATKHSKIAKRAKEKGPQWLYGHIGVTEYTKAGPSSKAGGLEELLSAEPGITAKESKTTQTNELTIRREDACWWGFHKNKNILALDLWTHGITDLCF